MQIHCYSKDAPKSNFIESGLLVGRGKEKSNFAGFLGANSRKKRPISREFSRPVSQKRRPISWELPEQVSLESDWFCADLRKVFNETRRSYRLTQASYRNMKEYFTSKLIEHNENK